MQNTRSWREPGTATGRFRRSTRSCLSPWSHWTSHRHCASIGIISIVIMINIFTACLNLLVRQKVRWRLPCSLQQFRRSAYLFFLGHRIILCADFGLCLNRRGPDVRNDIIARSGHVSYLWHICCCNTSQNFYVKNREVVVFEVA